MEVPVMAQIESESSPDLGELLFYPEVATIEKEEFRITSIELAAWAARKVLAARKRIEQRAELAAKYTERISAWLCKANAEDQGSIEFLISELRPFAEAEISKQHRSRTLHLPGVDVSIRKKPDRVDIIDERALLAYCEAAFPEAVVVVKSISKAKVLAHIKKEGELLPGIDFHLGDDQLYIKSDLDHTENEGGIIEAA